MPSTSPFLTNLTTRFEPRTSCGGLKALWIREVFDVGWADMHKQGVGSGAFDITNLRNGTYYVRVQVNPLVPYSRPTLEQCPGSSDPTARPGHRRVIVPWCTGIDTENTCDYSLSG